MQQTRESGKSKPAQVAQIGEHLAASHRHLISVTTAPPPAAPASNGDATGKQRQQTGMTLNPVSRINLDMLDEETKAAPASPDLQTPPEGIATPANGSNFLLAVPERRQRSSGPLGLRSPQLLRESMRGSRLAEQRGTSLRKIPSSTVSHMLTRSLSQLSEIEKELDQSSAGHLEAGF